jgi:putative phage-type endonuclease
MITSEQREQRRLTIGSSDSPAIVGVDPWRTAGDVYWSKIAGSDDEPSGPMRVGNIMEPLLLDLAEERLGGKVARNVCLPARGVLAANLDGQRGDTVIECKYVGPKGADHWGEDGTGDVPEHVQVQVQHQLYVAELPEALIPVAIVRPMVGLVFEFFQLNRDEALGAMLAQAAEAFWANHVAVQVPPPDSRPSLDILRRLRREPASLIPLGDDAMAAWMALEEAKDDAAKALNRKDDAMAVLLEFLGTNEAGRFDDGRMLTYSEENAGRRLKIAEFKQANPDLWEAFSEACTRRVLRLRKAPKL